MGMSVGAVLLLASLILLFLVLIERFCSNSDDVFMDMSRIIPPPIVIQQPTQEITKIEVIKEENQPLQEEPEILQVQTRPTAVPLAVRLVNQPVQPTFFNPTIRQLVMFPGAKQKPTQRIVITTPNVVPSTTTLITK